MTASHSCSCLRVLLGILIPAFLLSCSDATHGIADRRPTPDNLARWQTLAAPLIEWADREKTTHGSLPAALPEEMKTLFTEQSRLPVTYTLFANGSAYELAIGDYRHGYFVYSFASDDRRWQLLQ